MGKVNRDGGSGTLRALRQSWYVNRFFRIMVKVDDRGAYDLMLRAEAIARKRQRQVAQAGKVREAVVELRDLEKAVGAGVDWREHLETMNIGRGARGGRGRPGMDGTRGEGV